MTSSTALTDEIRALHAEEGRPAALVGRFRRSAVLVPSDGQDGLWSVEYGGIRWICAFTDEAALGRFALARGAAPRADGTTDWAYRTVLGARLLDVVVPAVGVPAGVALDVGSEHPMLFPPVAGIVPDAYAVNTDAGTGTGTDIGIGRGIGIGIAEGTA
ncbi:SseB family protein [Streptomyces aureoversilis]|uniref:SseB family protein n=1 Tax=Streptomyces aureoversilis TaxID=67277 RepID=A0ABV9ZYS5_9ACTN